MVTLVAIILLCGATFFGIRAFKAGSCVGFVTAIVCVIGFIISGVFILSDIYTVGTGYTIDQKIEMYEEENSAIEARVDSIVEAYKIYESETYKKYKIEDTHDAMTLVSLFPELRSDTLVQEEIELYIANNGKIKELKEEKIDISAARWRLYFGK